MSSFRAVYRLQLGPDLTFGEARRLVPYLTDLGISHLYLSPVTQARKGSTHGYDVVDPTKVSTDLGGEQELRELCSAGPGVLLDTVPNHMAAVDENPFWRDESVRSTVFDLDRTTGGHRRFFDVDELAGVRVEDPDVFEVTHRLVLGLVREGLVQGLRIDHPDGLADPAGYLRRLQNGGARNIWVEKILEPGEHLRDWPVEGTTGYEFANDVTALFVDPAGEPGLTAFHQEVSEDERTFAEVAADAKRELVETTFTPEVERLARLWDAPGLVDGLSSLPVYRTYVEPWSGLVADADRDALAGAELTPELRAALLLERRGHDAFVTRFQQSTGAVTAKAVEDTAFYRHARLLALNEVGGDPDRFWLSVDEFHRGNIARHARFPRHLLTSQTHDTKRSGDVRARLCALAGMAGEWVDRVRTWLVLTERHREGGAPDRQEQYVVFQTLVGAWPLERERLHTYIDKALREAKRTTSWVEQNPGWEARVHRYCERVLLDTDFLEDFLTFHGRVQHEGDRIAIGQLALRLTVPGVPDVYQGDELQSFSLVDPDNRRPVDWDLRAEALRELRAGAAPTPETAKLHVLLRTLDLRARRPEAFAAAYTPVEAGEDSCAFLRGRDVLVVTALRSGGGTSSAAALDVAGEWRNVVDGRRHRLTASRVAVAELTGDWPVAILERG